MSITTSSRKADRTGIPAGTRIAVVAVAATPLVTIAIWAIAQTGAGLKVRLGSGAATHVGAGSVLLASVLAAVAAIATRAFAERMSARPAHIWIRMAVVVFAVSLTGPLAAGTTTPTKLSLIGMHLAAAAILIATLARSPRGEKPADA